MGVKNVLGKIFVIVWRLTENKGYLVFSSVAQSCPTFPNPMNRSTSGLPVHHQLLQSTQTHVHWAGDAIQPSHPLSCPSPPALNPSQHQRLFQWKVTLLLELLRKPTQQFLKTQKPKFNLIMWPHLVTKACVLPFSRIDLYIHIHTLLLSAKEHPVTVTSRPIHHTFVLLLYLICIWCVNIYIHTHIHLLPPLPPGNY